MKTYRTFSSTETKMLGAVMAEKMLTEVVRDKAPQRTARIFALYGDLGAGKTTFTQGFLKALGVRGRVTSPTFVLMKKFSLKNAAVKKAGFKHVYHIDAYRFRTSGEATALELGKIFKDPQAIVTIEWPERLRGVVPRGAKKIRFKHGKKENERVIIAS